MRIPKVYRVILCALFCIGTAIGSARIVPAQDSNLSSSQIDSRREDETNLDTELYLILASNRGGETQVPASLDQVIKQLRATLPLKNYSLTSTLLNRVKNGGHVNLLWVGGPLLPSSPTMVNIPSFSDFSIGQVKLVLDGNGGQVVQLLRLSFGTRIPIQTGTNIAPSGTNSAPIFNYEHTGLTTDISVRVGEPAVVGTLNVGPTGEAIILVICVKRTQK